MIGNRAAAATFCFFLITSESTLSETSPLKKLNSETQSELVNQYLAILHTGIGNAANHQEVANWKVFANRSRAPIYTRKLDSFEETDLASSYLQEFSVYEKHDAYLRISNQNEWLKITHLLLFENAIRDPDSGIHLKVFPKVRLDLSSEDINLLRRRDAPSNECADTEANTCGFLTSADERIGSSGVFLYVYAVDFGDEQVEMYFNYENFLDAQYYLLGSAPRIELENPQATILGWLPAAGAIAWDTRQALDLEETRQPQLSHRFTQHGHFREYFSTSGTGRLLKRSLMEEYMVLDQPGRLFTCGNDLRFIVQEQFKEVLGRHEVSYASIGYTGQSCSAEGNEGLDAVDLQAWGKSLEFYFLLDATTSMRPSFQAAADVVDLILRREWDQVQPTVHAAVYRDQRDGARRFEEWPSESSPSLPEWLRDVQVSQDQEDTTYEEDLFNAIKTAVASWESEFRSELSTRVFVILGDAGWESETSESSRKAVADLFRENLIRPIAIQFLHPTKDPAEDLAISKFKPQLTSLFEEIYDSQNIPEIKSVDSGSLRDSLQQQVDAVVVAVEYHVNKMTLVRLGSTTILKGLCELAFDDPLRSECKAEVDSYRDSDVENLNRLTNFMNEHGKGTDRQASAMFTIQGLRQLQSQNPEVAALLNTHPQIGYEEGIVAIRVDDKPVTRPVYLFSQLETLSLHTKIDNLVKYYSKRCELEILQDVLRIALAYILGEGVEINTSDLTDERHSAWLAKVVEPGRNAISYSLLAEDLCADEVRWKIFISSLREVPDRLDEIRRDPDRTYFDPGGERLYWIYPEEILPIVD